MFLSSIETTHTNKMQDFIIYTTLQFLDGTDFTNLVQCSKYFQTFNNQYCWNRIWNKGRVSNVKTAAYIESKLSRYSPESIIDEIPNNVIMKDTLSAFRRLLSPKVRRQVYSKRRSCNLVRIELLFLKRQCKRLRLGVGNGRRVRLF
jgi:hypothetical protein